MAVICGHKGCKGQTPVAGRECYAGVSHKSLAIRGPKKKTNQPNHWHNKTRFVIHNLLFRIVIVNILLYSKSKGSYYLVYSHRWSEYSIIYFF